MGFASSNKSSRALRRLRKKHDKVLYTQRLVNLQSYDRGPAIVKQGFALGTSFDDMLRRARDTERAVKLQQKSQETKDLDALKWFAENTGKFIIQTIEGVNTQLPPGVFSPIPSQSFCVAFTPDIPRTSSDAHPLSSAL
eukprot:3361789-Pyramimonas_sp.AAC.1